MTSSSCKHLRKCKQLLLARHKALCEQVVFPLPATDERNAQLLSLMRCTDCGERDDSLLCCCMECVFFGCLARENHILQHLKQREHNFAICLETGHVFCWECCDFVYDRELETVRRDAENEQRRQLGLSLHHNWNPGKAEVELIRQARKSIIRVDVDTTLGLRGLVNMGNTCFMSTILQTLTHTPLLMDYFMTDQHRCNGKMGTGQCLMCEFSRVFQEFYSGQRAPHVPYRMLHLVWTHARHLAGYEQQDAHEFFIAALNVLHKHSRNAAIARGPHECLCIIDRIFTGRLQSDVTCIRCSCVSTTVDPYYDISLDLGSHHRPAVPHSVSSPALLATSDDPMMMAGAFSHSIAHADAVSWQPLPKTLADCLERYTRRELLGGLVTCDQCNNKESATKQLTLKKLPIVACFHLKRFEHSTKLHKKISTFVSFPEFLDMTPYTAAGKDGLVNGQQKHKLTNGQKAMETLANKYALFSVVNHHGTIEGGHYTCYIRQQADQWFKCDDHVISRASIDEVLSSEGYLLFYHKQFLHYD